jgi:uncharacterized protein (DUF433 family)
MTPGELEMNWREYITVDPSICHGRACVQGTRVMVSIVLDNLAAGVAIDELLKSYPSLTRDGILATMAYAADLARDRTVDLTSARPT